MHLMVVVFCDTEKTGELVRRLQEAGVSGATILEGVGAGRVKGDFNCTPLIAGFLKLLDNNHVGNKVLFSVIKREDILQRAIQEITAVLGDLNKPGTGILFTVPVDQAVGVVEQE